MGRRLHTRYSPYVDVVQRVWDPASGWAPALTKDDRTGLLLVFGALGSDQTQTELNALAAAHPQMAKMGCSTAGEIAGTRVLDGCLVATSVHFANTRVKAAQVDLVHTRTSYEAGEKLGLQLAGPGLVHVFVVSDGIRINGTALTRGLTDALPSGTTVTGGLSGDGSRFEHTRVWAGKDARPDSVVAVGLFGENLRIGHGSLGGWDPFGPERLITRSAGSVLYELDGLSALQLYKRYLGEAATNLPASGLLFPLAIRAHGETERLVRTIIAVDEEHQTLTFAGDVPEGSYARLMKANFDRLIDGAVGAARQSVSLRNDVGPELALLVSCVGRKMVLGQRIEEELEGVRDVVGKDVPLAGFYSYGEISPILATARCELHNQTMTITTLSEV